MSSASPWRSWSATDPGAARDTNEDAIVDRPADGVWAVADGAGGHHHGVIAAAALRAALDRPATPAAIRHQVAAVHQALLDRAAREPPDPGGPVIIASTLVAICATGPAYTCLWCGDSRAYRLRDGTLTRLTRDHSVVQDLVDAGILRPEDADSHPVAHLLTRAIGAPDQPPHLDEVNGQAQPGDRFLLCSDGLTKTLDEPTIAQLLSTPTPATALIDAALARTAQDNVTAIVLEHRTPV